MQAETMMPKNSQIQRQTVSFVVRLWAEYRLELPPTWRGEIICPDTGASRLFRDLADISVFIAEQTSRGLEAKRKRNHGELSS